MTLKRISIGGALLIVLAFAAFANASIDRGAIQGTVTDQQGAILPGAKVAVTNTATNEVQNLVTNREGFYLSTQLVPGKYLVHVESPGFSATDINEVAVSAGTTITINAQLKVGAVSQHIEVTAAPPVVESASSNFTTPLASTYIADLPLPGRNMQALVQLIPGMTQSSGPTGTLFGFNSEYAKFPDATNIIGSSISANGGQGGANAWYLDGSLNSVVGAESIAVNPSVDSIGEFNVVDNGLAPEWGWTSGAVINVVLKSGTNQVHGDIYEYNRNSSLSATNPFARRNAQGVPLLQPRMNWNNFGGTLGGPVYLPHLYNGKNRTFFFFSFDQTLLHENKPNILTVPQAAERQGDFTGDPRFAPVCGVNNATNCLYDPYSTTFDPSTGLYHRTAFSTPVIPLSSIDPVAKFYMASVPAPNFVDPLQQGPGGCGTICNNYIGPVGSALNTTNLSVKIDHSISASEKLFGEWLYNPSTYANFRFPWNGATAQTQLGIAGAYPYDTHNQIVALGLTSTLSPTMVNEARLMFSRRNIIPAVNSDTVAATSQVYSQMKGLNLPLQLPMVFGPRMSWGGLDAMSFGPVPWQAAIQGDEAFTVVDNLTKVLGKHTIKTGMLYRQDQSWYNLQFPLGLGFSSSYSRDPVTKQGGSGLASFLMGAVSQSTTNTGVFHAPYTVFPAWSLYGQDEYRVTHNLTVNMGLRWDMMSWFSERHNDLATVDFGLQNPVAPFQGAVVYAGTSQHPSRTLFPAYKGDFAPRISFAWSPFGSRSNTVIRGGYGLIYSNVFQTQFSAQNALGSSVGYSQWVGYQGDKSGNRPAFQLSKGAPTVSLPDLGNLPKNSPANQFLGAGLSTYFRGSKDPYVQQWSLNVQHGFTPTTMLSVGYVGTRGEHLIGDPYRNFDYVPTAKILQLRNNINNSVPVDASLGSVYGSGACPPDSALPGKVDCPGTIAYLPYPQYSAISDMISNDGWNLYNSLQVKLEKRASKGLNIIAAYTFQKNRASANLSSLANAEITPGTLQGNLGREQYIPGSTSFSGSASIEDPDNRRRYASLSPDDTPHILNLAVIYEPPFGHGKRFLNQNKALDKLVGGWKVTQNWNFQSGVPLVFTSGACNGVSCKPNLIGNPSTGRAGKSRQALENQWLNPSAFQAPFGGSATVLQEVTSGKNPDGTDLNYNTLDQWWQFGNVASNVGTALSPGYWNADLSLAKNFFLSESRRFEFRWELLNAFNHQNLGTPNTNWCLPPNADGSTDAIHEAGCQYGKITNVQTDPRAMEFALKFYW